MKYLVTAKAQRPGAGQAMTVAIAQAAKDYLNASVASGKMDCVYLFSTGDGTGFGIMNANSHEEVSEVIMNHPAGPLYEWEVQPLIDFNKGVGKFIELLQKQG
jgi:muconolactone delta-isomerase